VVQYLSRKCDALSSNPSAGKKKEREVVDTGTAGLQYFLLKDGAMQS
jgi:hypothetical protein